MLDQDADLPPIVGVPNPASDPDDVQRFISEVDPGVSHAVENAQGLWEQHGVLSQPTTILVHADGTTERINSFGRTGLLIRLEDLAATS